MDAHRHERRHHFRSKARPGRILPVRVQPAAHGVWVSAHTRNIGVGGAFVVTAAPIEVGTRLTLELILPTTDRVFVLPAVVRWAAPGDGVGVQFEGVDVDILLELNDYFSSLT